MHYLKFGNSKRFIVFLHGWGADLNSFIWLKDLFIEDYSLIFLDFPGFGNSEIPQNSMCVSDYVSVLKKLLDEFDIEELTFVAHSFGGRVAIKFLFYYQNSYKNVKLCLIDSAGILPRRNLIYKIKVAKFKRLKKKAETSCCARERLNDFGSSDYKVLCPIMKQTFVRVVNEDLSEYAKFLNCKTIIVWGQKDKETKLYMARILHKLIRGSELFVLKDAGHFSFIEKKEDFAIILDTFMKNL